ncbi:uncharacterized protein LOC132034320 [Lycium ferocissimum]|uniref:uncharacterized protein LOC132034320 n=1 Tax=Lycium ferocissimum TaxID=112874 RepID=UPI002815A9E3|nr:uncharacterized protein LOC132034320 [Lycium ferocissimum]
MMMIDITITGISISMIMTLPLMFLKEIWLLSKLSQVSRHMRELLMVFLRNDTDLKKDAYADRALSEPLLVNLVPDLPHQFYADCSVFSTAFAEYFIMGKNRQEEF